MLRHIQMETAWTQWTGYSAMKQKELKVILRMQATYQVDEKIIVGIKDTEKL